jgi:hypothetical protein
MEDGTKAGFGISSLLIIALIAAVIVLAFYVFRKIPENIEKSSSNVKVVDTTGAKSVLTIDGSTLLVYRGILDAEIDVKKFIPTADSKDKEVDLEGKTLYFRNASTDKTLTISLVTPFKRESTITADIVVAPATTAVFVVGALNTLYSI